MPGLVAAPSAPSFGATAGMKRALGADAGEAAPAFDGKAAKKRRVIHELHHTQPIQHIHDPVSAEFDPTEQSKDFFDHQLRRAIAIECKGVGFDSAKPDALEGMRGMADSFMLHFLGLVRKSMSSARRTTPVAHDWVYALKSVGISGSSVLEQHLDSGSVPPELLQPPFPPPKPADPPPPDLEGLLGPGLSGRAEKESKSYIPAHFPIFPPKHAWKATPVYTQRENDPRIIRERATEEGILAEQALRKLMVAQKAGLQKNKAKTQRRSKRIRESDKLWQTAMQDLLKQEADREEEERNRRDDDEEYESDTEEQRQQRDQRKKAVPATVNLQDGVHVNYDQKFWRTTARGV